ncbi:MAG TPA: hypothetical protein DCQ83_03685 [Fibrobacteres bacterium]|nr:hypothetical protein [Fibrobacterota bacterium]
MSLPALAGAGEDPVDLFRRHRYEAAAAIWEKEVHGAVLDEKGVRSLKGLSMSYHQLGRLYSRLQPFSSAVASTYYKGILAEQKSALSLYYLGQLHYQGGRWDSAIVCFEKARKLGGDKVPEENDVFLGYATARKKKSANPALQPKSNAAQWQVLDLSGGEPSGIPAGLKAYSPRARRCRLSILSRSTIPLVNETYAALQAVLHDAGDPETIQDPGKNTQIDFYDPFLLETLQRGYFALSQWRQMQLLKEEKRFPELARKFETPSSLSETCLWRGQYADALQYLGQPNDTEGRLLRARILGKQGKLSEARPLLEGAAKDEKNPVILREIAESYYFLAIDFQKGLKLASQALKDKDGASYFRIFAALLLASGQNDAALQEYAKGYKIEFRNRIDEIDPEYMVDYAHAIFLTSKMRYEEIVETLYHLQKEIPACRQIHYAMQGVSASQARNYESQKIFRKGG